MRSIGLPAGAPCPAGAAVLLDFVEETFPVCHGQSHELGKAPRGAHNLLSS
jgi:hypothetical protein